MANNPICTISHLHHTAIAVKDIRRTINRFNRLFGIGQVKIKAVNSQKVLAALVTIGNTELEFIQPMDSSSGVARFIEKRGEGLHHICFEVSHLSSTLKNLKEEGVLIVDQEPTQGLAGMVAFLHPKSVNGILVELVDSDTTEDSNGN